MSITKLSLAGNSKIIPGQGEFGQCIPAEEGKIANFFVTVLVVLKLPSQTSLSPPFCLLTEVIAC
jgi:hypothetical protein